MTAQQITKDTRLRRARSDGLCLDDGSRSLQRAVDGFRQDHLGDPRPFLGSARQEVHRLQRKVRHRERSDFARRVLPDLPDEVRRDADGQAEGQVRQRIRALDSVVDLARRAGRAVAVGFALPYFARSGRAGICREPDARRGAPRDRLLALCPGALGQAVAGRRDAWFVVDRTRACAGGLQKDRRHADAGRRVLPWARSRRSTPSRAIRCWCACASW